MCYDFIVIFSDGWKVKECVNNHVTSCGEEEKNHMMSEMMEKFKNIPETCKDKKALDMCALEFKDITKKLLGLDMKLDWGMEGLYYVLFTDKMRNYSLLEEFKFSFTCWFIVLFVICSFSLLSWHKV